MRTIKQTLALALSAVFSITTMAHTAGTGTTAGKQLISTEGLEEFERFTEGQIKERPIQFTPEVATQDGDTVFVNVGEKTIVISSDSIDDVMDFLGGDFADEISDISSEISTAVRIYREEMALIEGQLEDGEITEEEAEAELKMAEEKMEARIAELEAELESLAARVEQMSGEIEGQLFVSIEERSEEDLEEEEEFWSSEEYESEEEEFEFEFEIDEDSGKRTVGSFDFLLGANNYLDANNQLPTDANYGLKTFGSWHLAANFGRKTRIGNEGSPLHLKYGLEFSLRNYNLLDDKYAMMRNDSAVMFSQIPTGSYEKNNFNALWLNVPLMIQLDFSDNRALENGFNIALGGYAGVRLSSNTKVEYRDDYGNLVKNKTRGNFLMNDLHYGLQAQLGVGWVNLYARYELSTLFREDRGPQLNGLMFGIII